jgi:hypothetical protein
MYMFADSGSRGSEGVTGRQTEGEETARELVTSDDDPRSYHAGGGHGRPHSALTGDFGWGRPKPIPGHNKDTRVLAGADYVMSGRAVGAVATPAGLKDSTQAPAKPGPSEQRT